MPPRETSSTLGLVFPSVVWLPQLLGSPRPPKARCNRSVAQSITYSVWGTRTEAAVIVDAATRGFDSAGPGGPGRPPRLKAGKAPAKRGQARSQALRWAGVVGCAAVVLVSLILVVTPSAAAVGALRCHLGLASSTGQSPGGH